MTAAPSGPVGLAAGIALVHHARSAGGSRTVC
jgi:hypothetical protein